MPKCTLQSTGKKLAPERNRTRDLSRRTSNANFEPWVHEIRVDMKTSIWKPTPEIPKIENKNGGNDALRVNRWLHVSFSGLMTSYIFRFGWNHGFLHNFWFSIEWYMTHSSKLTLKKVDLWSQKWRHRVQISAEVYPTPRHCTLKVSARSYHFQGVCHLLCTSPTLLQRTRFKISMVSELTFKNAQLMANEFHIEGK